MNDSRATITERVSVSPEAIGSFSEPQIPDHELIRRVGSGAFGEVWLARNVMGTYRAVKLIYRRNFEQERSYEREFTGMEKFEPVSRSHDGLVDILQIGRNEVAGYYYYVMELGDDLASGGQINPDTYNPKTLGKETAHRGHLPCAECVRIGICLAGALNHLHENGLIHRDIKPSNIIFVRGIPKIADIGLVAELGSAGSVVGTPGFIPPEGPGTAQGDIYSLGKVLYEISTGKDRQNFPDLPTLGGSIGSSEFLELNEVILKACETDVRKRYKTADELRSDLLLLEAGKSLKRIRILEQRLAFATKMAIIAAIVILIGAGAFYQIYRENQRRTHQLAASYVASGTRSMDDGDLIGSLPWFADALELEGQNPARAELHRVRLASILRECPKIVQMWFQPGYVNSAEFSSDGQRMVTAGTDGLPRIYEVRSTNVVILPLQHSKELNSACFSADGRLVLTASEDHTVRVIETQSGKEVLTLLHPDAVNSAKFDTKGDLIVTACSDGIARVWDRATGLLKRAFTNHTAPLLCATFSPDGLRVASTGQDGTVRVWLAATGEEFGRKPFKHKSWVYDVAFSPDGRYLATASFDWTAQIFDTETGQRLSLLHSAPVHSAEFSPDGRYIVTASWDYTARIWNAATGEPVKAPLKHGGNVIKASFSPEGRRIVTTSTSGVTCLWDLAPSNWLPASISAYVSSDGNRFATISNNWVRVWNADGAKSDSTLFHVTNQVYGIKFSRDGGRLVTLFRGNSSANRAQINAQLWNSRTGTALAEPFSVDASFKNLQLSQDGQRLLSIVSNYVNIWDTHTGMRLAHLDHPRTLQQASFNPAADRVVTVCGTNVYIWNARQGTMLGILPHATAVYHAAFSPDSRWLVTSCSDSSLSAREAQIWDAQTYQKIGTPLKHRDGVRFGSFSPDGRLVVTASEDRTAQVWMSATGKQVGPPLKHKDEVWSAAFSPNGRRIVTVCRDNTARVWDSQTGEALTPPLKAPPAWFDYGWSAQFTPDGHSVIARNIVERRGQNVSSEARLYSLVPEDRKIEDLVLVAQLLSGHQGDQVSGASALTSAAYRAIWEKLNSPNLSFFVTSSNEILFWHEREADASEREEQWFAAQFHLRHLIVARPDDSSLRERAARIEAKLAALPSSTADNIK